MKKNVLNDNAIWHILWNIPLAPFARGIHPRIINQKSNIIHHKSYIKHEQISLAKNPEHRHHGAYRHRHHFRSDFVHGRVIAHQKSPPCEGGQGDVP